MVINSFLYFSDEPPAKPIQLWSKNQIAVEYDSDSETAAAPTTNRLVGKHVWKGAVFKKPSSNNSKSTDAKKSASGAKNMVSSKKKDSTATKGGGSKTGIVGLSDVDRKKGQS